MENQRKKILILGAVWPEPTSSAAGVRTTTVVEAFRGRGHEVVFAATAGQPDSSHCRALVSAGCSIATVQPNDSAFDSWLSELNPDAVIFDRFMLEEQFGWRVEKTIPDAARILDTSDLHFLRKARMRWAERNPWQVAPVFGAADFWEKLGSDLRHGDTWRELASILRSDRSWVVSRAELELLRELGIPTVKLSWHPLTAAPEKTSAAGFVSPQRAGFVTIGNFRHPPNLDSVLWLKNRIWRGIRERIHAESGEKVELQIYGSYPSREAMALDSSADGFRVLGPADDAIATLSRYRVCLCPLRFGAGVKGKVLDSWSAGTPVVTTSIGAEGFSDFSGLIADGEDSIVDGAVRLYLDEQEGTRLSRKASEILRQNHDPSRVREGLAADGGDILLTLSERREKDWLGPVLWQQSARSTEYFSRWIEAKNRQP